jgi:CheY-like chemotaxis protein
METLVIWSVAVCRRTECTAAGRHRRDRIQAFGRDGGMEIMYLVRGDHRSLEYRQSRVGECGLVRLAPRPVFAREVAVVGRRSAPSETVAFHPYPRRGSGCSAPQGLLPSTPFSTPAGNYVNCELLMKCRHEESLGVHHFGLVTDTRVDVRNLKVPSHYSQISLPATSQRNSALPRSEVPLCKETNPGRTGDVQTVISPLKATILCVDDHWSGLIGRKMLLESNGYEVLEATSGDEGLSLFLSHSVDVVVLDYLLPGMKGDVVAAKMKRAKSHVPIMLLSSYGPLPKSKLQAVDIFLSKSQPPKILLSTLQHLLSRRPRPFFGRWFETWRSRNEGVRQ